MILNGNVVALPECKRELIDDLQILRSDRLYFDEYGDSYKIRYGNRTYNPDEVLHFPLNPDDDYPFK